MPSHIDTPDFEYYLLCVAILELEYRKPTLRLVGVGEVERTERQRLVEIAIAIAHEHRGPLKSV